MSTATVAGRVTIGITCFNASDTIRRAIECALTQHWADLEVIVVDDCSVDGSPAIIEDLARSRPGIRVIRHAVNTGPGAARSSILAAATGEYLAFFDDDDLSTPERVAVQVARLDSYERETGAGLVACYASGARRYPNGYELAMPAIGSRPRVPSGAPVADYLLFNHREPDLFYGAGTPTCALLARTSTLRAVGGFDAGLRRAEDVDLAIRLALAGGHFVGCPEALFTQYATVSADKSPGMNQAAELQLIEKHSAYLERRGRYRYALQWFRLRHLHFSGQRGRFVAALLLFLLQYPLSGVRHLLRTIPTRRAHERRISA